MNNNPSPGNKAGGLTTILEKSLGAVAKGGTTNLVAVYEYAEPVTAHGFVFMDTPGYDPVSATGQVAGGANMICFTTGRGSAYGCKPSPSLKLATNSAMFNKQEEDMDINCGVIVDGKASIQEVGEQFFQKMWNPMSFPIPGMFQPTMSVEEVEKKIAELQSVENWLKMNLTFVQMTMKTLEMQKSALQSIQESAAATSQKAPKKPKDEG